MHALFVNSERARSSLESRNSSSRPFGLLHHARLVMLIHGNLSTERRNMDQHYRRTIVIYTMLRSVLTAAVTRALPPLRACIRD